MTTPLGFSLALSLGLTCALALGACGDDEPEDTHTASSPSCAAIMQACHEADFELGPAHDCHALAHEDEENDCAAQKTTCIQTCEDVLADAGHD